MSDESVDNKTQEQRASGSEQVLGMERVSALIMRPSTHQDPNRRRRGQSTGRSPRYRLRRTRKAVPEWLALSAGPGKTRRPVVRGRGGNGAEFLDGTSVTAPPCYPAGRGHSGSVGGQLRKRDEPMIGSTPREWRSYGSPVNGDVHAGFCGRPGR